MEPTTGSRTRVSYLTLSLVLVAAACRGKDDSSATIASDSSHAHLATTSSAAAPVARDSMTVTVYKSPTCGCCSAWVDHLRASGFQVVAIDTDDVDAVKRQHGVRADHASCHTALVGGYVLEGHVPAADVRRLLAERPAVTGLAVPGMPQGSPGMETGMKDPYDVVAFTRDGATSVFARH